MTSQIRTAADFYERHPISAQIILTKLEAARGTLDNLRPDELFPHDQDHYGGTPANDALAKCAHIGSGTKVVDPCAGLGGPARYLAHRYGASVTGVELTPARVAGASELTRRVGLDKQVRVIEGDVTALPLPVLANALAALVDCLTILLPHSKADVITALQIQHFTHLLGRGNFVKSTFAEYGALFTCSA